jgi:hypothetical protein
MYSLSLLIISISFLFINLRHLRFVPFEATTQSTSIEALPKTMLVFRQGIAGGATTRAYNSIPGALVRNSLIFLHFLNSLS